MENRRIKIADLVLNEGQISGLPTNPRSWTKLEMERLKKSLQETPELFEARGIIVYPYEGKYLVLGGNMRLSASKELKMKDVPCIVVPEGTPVDKLKEIVIKDNGSFGDWDYDLLANEWDDLPLTEWGVPAWEVCDNNQQVQNEEKVDEEECEIEEDKVAQRCNPGEIWDLGGHRLMCGDSTSERDVRELMGGDIADICFTDPPYGMKKECDGVQNDNLNYDDLLEFNKKWIPLTFKYIKENGSWYCWGIDEPLFDIYAFILKPMQRKNECTFRNFITWAKHSAFGINSELMRCYPRETEKCLFVMKGVQGFNNNADHFNDAYSTLLEYMQQEAAKIKLTPKLLTEITGVQMYSHWFTKSQFTPIPERHLDKLREYSRGTAFIKTYAEVRDLIGKPSDEYKNLKEAVLGNRAYFNNTHNDPALFDIMTDVWRFPVTSMKEREDTGGHATPKPINLCMRAIKTSSREGEIVLDLFGGSGSTLIACEKTKRRCYMMELDPHYCDVIIARWEKVSGGTAKLLNK